MAIQPQIVASPNDWRGPEIDYRKDGLHVFTNDEIDEIDAGLHHLKSLGDIDFNGIGPEQFPLGRIVELLCDARDKLRRGHGFMLLRGLPRQRYSVDDMARIYLGLGAYIGQPMVQSYQGELLGHVVDLTDIEQAPRAYHRGGKQDMHTDSCDVIGLMCLRTALRGGASRICSSIAVHNEIVRTRRDLAEILYRGFHYRRTDLDAKYGSGVVTSQHRITVFARTEDEVSCYFLAGYAYRAADRGDVVLSDLEPEAIDLMQKLANSPEFYLDMEFSDGDIQFLNNRVIFHGRTDYEDSPDIEFRRHLLRLWLAMPSWPPLPSSQVFHTPEDRRLWSKQRSPLMEMPSTYVQKLREQYHGLGLATTS